MDQISAQTCSCEGSCGGIHGRSEAKLSYGGCLASKTLPELTGNRAVCIWSYWAVPAKACGSRPIRADWTGAESGVFRKKVNTVE